MIRKIQSNEYLKRLGNMDAAEKEGYVGRVGDWLRKKAPLLLSKTADPATAFDNAVQCSAGWNDQECRAWEEGAQLLTALAGKEETWLPDMLYTKAARRTIRRMAKCLSDIGCRKEAGDDGSSQRMAAGAAKESGYGKATKEVPAANIVKPTQAVAAKPVPVRPKHIDQYVHLLPKKTQERAATVRELLREMDVAREKMRLLMNDPKSSAGSRASWATSVTNLDKKVKDIYKELDAEWDKLVKQGRVAVDDFGNAHVTDDVRSNTEDVHQPSGISHQASKDKAKRIEYLKKWLRDTRTKQSDERKKQWEQNCKELLKLGGEITDSIRRAGEHYGAEFNV